MTSGDPTQRFRLRTFGGIALVGAIEGQGLSNQGPQRRRLALLAVLAASGERGRSRDQLLGLFWPEVSQERARHSLEQTLYAIRGSLDPGVFLGVNPVSLNSNVITSDVADFERALSQGEPAAAVEYYQGPFLDGFYLGDAPEFERWVERERTRLERSLAEAVERLAAAAEASRDWTHAVHWWRRLADADPVSERYAVGLMRALANAGDRATALRHAELHQATVERELETSVGPEVAAFVAALRSSAVTGASPIPEAVASPLESPGQAALPSAVAHPGAVPPPLRQDAPTAPVRRTRRIVGYAGAAVLAVGVILGLLRVAGGGPARRATGSAAEPSIVVLPLARLGGDAGDAAFADGMTEELTAMLAKLGGLRVIATTSAFAFKGRPLDVRQIAESLRVSHILEGGLQRIDSRLRLQVRLVDARDGSTRWSEIYDREMQDLFATEDDLARTIARELEVRLLPVPATSLVRHRTRSIAAYDLYLRGRDPTLLRSDSGARVGLEYFDRAIAIDSSYAAAYAGRAHMYGVLGLGGSPGTPRRELYARAEAAARKAVALDDSLPEAHAELGFVQLAGVSDLSSAETELHRALALDPATPKVHEYLAVIVLITGRAAEGLAEARLGLERDPLSPSANAEVARALYANGRCGEALAQIGSLAGVRPALRRTAITAGLCLAEAGRWSEAIAVLRERAAHGGSGARGMLGLVLARAGYRDEARQLLANLLTQQQRRGDLSLEVAVVYAGLGDLDRSFTWLDRAVDEGAFSPEIMGPAFRELRRDPRFERVRQHLGQRRPAPPH